jgi:hypothetical protein
VLSGPNTRTGEPDSRIVSASLLKSPSPETMQNTSLRPRLSSVMTSITSAMSAAIFPGVLRNTSMGLTPRLRKSRKGAASPEPPGELRILRSAKQANKANSPPKRADLHNCFCALEAGKNALGNARA